MARARKRNVAGQARSAGRGTRIGRAGRSGVRRTQGRAGSAATLLGGVFPRLRRRGPLFGFGALCAIVEAEEGKRSVCVGPVDALDRRPDTSQREKLLEALDQTAMARLFGALGSPRRLGILGALFSGARSYAELVGRLNMKAGPLYHHVRELRLAGLLEPEGRDCYRLSKRGMYAWLAACSVDALLKRAFGA